LNGIRKTAAANQFEEQNPEITQWSPRGIRRVWSGAGDLAIAGTTGVLSIAVAELSISTTNWKGRAFRVAGSEAVCSARNSGYTVETCLSLRNLAHAHPMPS